MICGKCKHPLSTQDRASYGYRCEDCFTNTTVALPNTSLLLRHLMVDRHSKTGRNSIPSETTIEQARASD